MASSRFPSGGGGGTPGGSSGDVQFNNAGAFGGFGDWNGTTLTVDAAITSSAGGTHDHRWLNGATVTPPSYATRWATVAQDYGSYLNSGALGTDTIGSRFFGTLYTNTDAGDGPFVYDNTFLTTVDAASNNISYLYGLTGSVTFNKVTDGMFGASAMQAYVSVDAASGSAVFGDFIGMEASAIITQSASVASLYGALYTVALEQNTTAHADLFIGHDVRLLAETGTSFTDGYGFRIRWQNWAPASGTSLTALRIEDMATLTGVTTMRAINYADKFIVDSAGVAKAVGYKSSDGSAGVTAGPFTTITSITVKNGLITALTGS